MILPGFPQPIRRSASSAAGATFSMTAGLEPSGSSVGWRDASVGPAYGSAIGDFNAGGGTIVGLSSGGGVSFLFVFGGNQSATSVSIDGTPYALTFLATDSGVDVYVLEPPDFTNTVTYQIVAS